MKDKNKRTPHGPQYVWMVKTYVLTTLFVGFCLTALAEENSTNKLPLQKGEKAPTFALRDLEGNYVILSDVLSSKSEKNATVVLNFWATWCEPCMKEMPHLIAIMKKYQSENVRFFLISENKMSETEKVRDYVADKEIEGKVLLDPYNVVLKKYNPSQSIPLTFVISSSGTILARIPFTESFEKYKKKLRKAIAKAQQEKK